MYELNAALFEVALQYVPALTDAEIAEELVSVAMMHYGYRTQEMI